ncbi:hypothetical protein BDR07DRAFT_1272902 [Suillus spraguei]|nr:hypothetical protein BDR07DRAFT_1272902 [Suillus spraguei]
MLFPLNTSNFTIVSKHKETLAKARDDTTPPGTIKSVRTLHNGGIVVGLEMESLAVWLSSPNSKAALESNMESTVSFHKCFYQIVLEFLPIGMQIEHDDFLQQIEQENYLQPSSLAAIRWIKPPARCTAEQRKAFALLQVTDVQTANDIL